MAAVTLSDDLITTKVREQLAYDPRVSALDLRVATNNGVVALYGHVDSEAQAAAAVAAASRAEGVRMVENRLEVRPIRRPTGEKEVISVPGRPGRD